MVDWEKHWEQHALNFSNGCLVLKIKGSAIYLRSGPGFGDMSHETTQLVFDMMSNLVEGRYIFDIGCGSGILGIAAAAFGAEHVWSVDIDSQAMMHTQENITFNNLDDKITVVKTLPIVDRPLALMNMIWNEQKLAWPENVNELITSGILEEQKKDYLDWVKELGFECLATLQKGVWCSFHLSGEK